jgi:hypothetical protein
MATVAMKIKVVGGIAASLSSYLVKKSLDTHEKKSRKGIPEPRAHYIHIQ